jgi:hypothetical protein
MDLESPSSHRPADIEDEDSPLQQSAHPLAHSSMADSYLEDIASEAEEDTKGKTAEEKKENDGGTKVDEPEQLPIKLHGYWEKCQIKDFHVLALQKEGTVAPKAESQWRIDYKALVSAPNKTKVLMLKSHIERGFSMPPSHFFSNHNQ